MKLSLFNIIFILAFTQVHLNLRKEQREELLKKVSNKIIPTDDEQSKCGCKDISSQYYEDFEEESFKALNYNVTEIKELMEKYNLPLEYNYFNDTSAEIIVKNQKKCGSCWSFSATSALAYRFFKKGIEVELSPQDAVSCYQGNCQGNPIIDTQLNLVKNGTLTEECFPYASGDGKTIPQCPSKCVDDSIEFKKYHAQNAYYVSNQNQENFKNVVMIIMDQIVTQGPVQGTMYVYSDFDQFGANKTQCLNEVYTYDEISEYMGAHALAIVGYGLLDNKFYWSVQNSWGDDWCDGGFIKMEINQFLEFSFSEPYVEKEIEPVKIDVNYKYFTPDCAIQVETDLLDQWNNTLNINLENKETKQILEVQIGKIRILGKDEFTTNTQVKRIYYQLNKGIYEFKNYESLGKENTFSLTSFENIKIPLYGYDIIKTLETKNFYISEIGSKIVFYHYYYSNDVFPPVFLYQNEFNQLGNCVHLKTSTFIGYIGFCEIEQNNLDFFKKHTNSILIYNVLCGYYKWTDINVYLLDKTKYPVFRINQFFLPKNNYINNETDIIINAYVEGSTKFYSNDDNQFYTLIDIEYSNSNKTAVFICSAEIPFINNRKSNLTCHTYDGEYKFNNLYLLPYSINYKMSSPFEVIIEQAIKAGEEPLPPQPETDTTDSDEPDTTDHDTTGPDTSEPDTTDHDTTGPDTSEPDTTDHDTTGPDTSEPDTTDHDTTGPDTTDHDTTEPETTAPIVPTGSCYLKYSLYFLISILLL